MNGSEHLKMVLRVEDLNEVLAEGSYEDRMAAATERNMARRKAAEAKGASSAKADKADKAVADRMKKNGSNSFISVRKA